MDYAYWKHMILDGLEDNMHIVDAILMCALVFAVFIYYLEYFGKNPTTSTQEGESIIERGYGRNANAGNGSNCNRAGNIRTLMTS